MKEQCQVLSSVKYQWAAERKEMKHKFEQTRNVIMELRRNVEDKEAKLTDLEGQLATRSDEVGVVPVIHRKVGKLLFKSLFGRFFSLQEIWSKGDLESCLDGRYGLC